MGQLGWVWFGDGLQAFLLIININKETDDVFDIQLDGASIGVADFTANNQRTWYIYTWNETTEAQIVNGFIAEGVNGWPNDYTGYVGDRVVREIYPQSGSSPGFSQSIPYRFQAITTNNNNNFGYFLTGFVVNGISYVRTGSYTGGNFLDQTGTATWPSNPLLAVATP